MIFWFSNLLTTKTGANPINFFTPQGGVLIVILVIELFSYLNNIYRIGPRSLAKQMVVLFKRKSRNIFSRFLKSFSIWQFCELEFLLVPILVDLSHILMSAFLFWKSSWRYSALALGFINIYHPWVTLKVCAQIYLMSHMYIL